MGCLYVDFEIGGQCVVVFFQDVDGIVDVIIVIVGQNYMVDIFCYFVYVQVCRKYWIVG